MTERSLKEIEADVQALHDLAEKLFEELKSTEFYSSIRECSGYSGDLLFQIQQAQKLKVVVEKKTVDELNQIMLKRFRG
jgi:hypothetical protein